MKILITGGSGFIGGYLKKHLSQYHDIAAPTSDELDLENYKNVENFFNGKYFDIVVHAAGKGRDNVTGDDSKITYNILTSFFNLYINREHYGKLINFGSGAEFNLDRNMENIYEDEILNARPKESYGIAKNYVARIIREHSQFYNLRIFACFDPSESSNRLVTKFKNTVDKGRVFTLDQDRYVDFISLKDIATVVDAVLLNQMPYQDINLVYQDKFLVSDMLNKYCKVNDINPQLLQVSSVIEKNYTGDGNRLAKCNLLLEGIIPTLVKYKG